MIIKKLVVGSLFSMLLVSEMAAADWGDVYYCQMTNFIEITIEGEKESNELDKFQFKLDQAKNAMVFGDKGYLRGFVLDLYTGSQIKQERWAGGGVRSLYKFDEGNFLYSSMLSRALIISAYCDKF